MIGVALAGRYEILYELGHGGMAIVYAATDRPTSGLVAVKVMRAELAVALGAERFTREVRVTAKLCHPGIVPCLMQGSPRNCRFTQCHWCPGETLAQRLAREQQLGLEDTLQVIGELLDALGYAHESGILDRDIKPVNILLSGGRALLADFEIPRAMEVEGERLTQSGIAVGTTEYMSPEQAAADKINQRSDLYSLACMLYEILAGVPPYTGASAQAVRARHARDVMPSLQTVRPTVSSRLNGVVAKALAKVPADRFATARELRDALRHPELLLPDTATRPAMRHWQRVLRAVGVSALALVCGRHLVARRSWCRRCARCTSGDSGPSFRRRACTTATRDGKINDAAIRGIHARVHRVSRRQCRFSGGCISPRHCDRW